MEILDYRDASYPDKIAKLSRRAKPPAGVEEVVKGVIADVKARGDAALMELAKKFETHY